MVKLKGVILACEGFYAGVFCGGNVAQARGLMLPQKTDERVDLAQFQVNAGAAVFLLVRGVLLCMMYMVTVFPLSADRKKETHMATVKMRFFFSGASLEELYTLYTSHNKL